MTVRHDARQSTFLWAASQDVAASTSSKNADAVHVEGVTLKVAFDQNGGVAEMSPASDLRAGSPWIWSTD